MIRRAHQSRRDSDAKSTIRFLTLSCGFIHPGVPTGASRHRVTGRGGSRREDLFIVHVKPVSCSEFTDHGIEPQKMGMGVCKGRRPRVVRVKRTVQILYIVNATHPLLSLSP